MQLRKHETVPEAHRTEIILDMTEAQCEMSKKIRGRHALMEMTYFYDIINSSER